VSQGSRERAWRSRGYLAANRDKNLIIIMIADSECKRYLIANLSEALEVFSGRRAFCKLLERR